MRYVRVEYTGFAFDEEHEANGITFYCVGNGTTVEYCQAYRGSDDGFEWFGGSVNVKYLVSTDCSDDSFDWTEGWNGKAQFLVAYQSPKDELGYDCDCQMCIRDSFYYNQNKLNPTITDIYDTDSFRNMENVENGSITIDRKKQPKDSYTAGNSIYAGYIATEYYPVAPLLAVSYTHLAALWHLAYLRNSRYSLFR